LLQILQQMAQPTADQTTATLVVAAEAGLAW
jgi:hypothetical protein